MTDKASVYSLTGIYLPKRKVLTNRLQNLSFLINDATIFVAVLFVFSRVLSTIGLNLLIDKFFYMSSLAGVLFLFSGISLLFSAKRHIFNPKDKTKTRQSGWTLLTPILFAFFTAVLGLLSFTHLNQTFGVPWLQTSPFSGFCFFLIGLALIPPHTWLPHRFHVTQGLISIVIYLNSLMLLETVYQLFSSSPMQHLFTVPLATSCLFIFFCIGILCRWSNRGYSGNFTLTSVDSTLALRLVALTLLAFPLIGFSVLLLSQHTTLNIYQIAALIVILLTVASFSIIWINVKLLYKHDLEYFVMKEALRVHNIDVNLEKENLQERMTMLEEKEKQYRDKLNYQSSFREVAEKLD